MYTDLIGKTISDVTEEELVGKDGSKTWISWPLTTLHFTDGTTYSFAEDRADVYYASPVEAVNADEISIGNVYRDVFGEWHTANDVQVLAGGAVSIDGDEYGPADKIDRKRPE